MAMAFFCPTRHDQFLAPRDAGVEQISLQHGVVLRHYRDDDSWVLRPLAFVNGRSIGRHQRIEFAKPVGDGPAVEAGGEFAVVRADVVDIADVAVVDILVIVVLDLHDLVAGPILLIRPVMSVSTD